jgi:hypothetical protein
MRRASKDDTAHIEMETEYDIHDTDSYGDPIYMSKDKKGLWWDLIEVE